MKWIYDVQNPATEWKQPSGKAGNLAILTNSGLPVPAWFCISREAFCEFFDDRLRQSIEHIHEAHDLRSHKGAGQAASEIVKLIGQKDLPHPLVQALDHCLAKRGEGLFAVRSSACEEDSAHDSFAGQLDTFLFVPADGVARRIKDCWASYFNPSSMRYRLERNLPWNWSGMTVVVQAMVQSQASGVLFMANPDGRLHQGVIVAGWGLGEGVVSDRVETDQFTFDCQTREHRDRIATKYKQVVFDAGSGCGTRLDDVPVHLQSRPVLLPEQIRELIELGEKINSLFDHPQDIEWALDAQGKFYITQSRPITTIPRGSRTLFDNSNIVESYPGITLPLTFSYIRQAYEVIFRNACLALGIPRKEVFHNRTVFRNLLGYLDGRVYYTLSNWYQMLLLLPGMEKFLHVWEYMLGIRKKSEDRPGRTGWKRLKVKPVQARIIWRLASGLVSLSRKMKRIKAKFAQVSSKVAAVPLDSVDNQALLKIYHDSASDLFYGWEITLVNDLYAFLFAHLAKKALERAGAPDAQGLFHGLLCGEADMESVEPVRSLVGLGRWVRTHPALSEHLLKAGDGNGWEPDALRLEKVEGGREFLKGVKRHLDLYGNRCLEELKLETVSLRDRPGMLLQTILNYAASDISVEEMEAKEQRIRQQARHEVRRLFGLRVFKRLLFSLHLYLARRSIRYRESSRLDRARAYDIPRQLFRTVGKNLRREGALQSEDDIFYLGVDEVEGHIFGNSLTDSLIEIVRTRRIQFEVYRTAKPDERILCQGTVRQNTIPRQEHLQYDSNGESAAQNRRLQGIGCSPGIVRARIKIVTDPSEARDVAGRILVAAMTDPGWVFLMVLAAGLVVEKGSVLSHTAIIGRELGIPTVVGVADATSCIPDGALAELNGELGTLTILDREPEPEQNLDTQPPPQQQESQDRS